MTCSFYLGIIRRVKLDNPIHFRYIQTPRCHISTQHCSRTGIAKLKKGRCTFLLLLLSLEENSLLVIIPQAMESAALHVHKMCSLSHNLSMVNI